MLWSYYLQNVTCRLAFDSCCFKGGTMETSTPVTVFFICFLVFILPLLLRRDHENIFLLLRYGFYTALIVGYGFYAVSGI